jgi:hypothetical protein
LRAAAVTARDYPWTDGELRSAAAVAAWAGAPVERILAQWFADLRDEWPEGLC